MTHNIANDNTSCNIVNRSVNILAQCRWHSLMERTWISDDRQFVVCVPKFQMVFCYYNYCYYYYYTQWQLQFSIEHDKPRPLFRHNVLFTHLYAYSWIKNTLQGPTYSWTPMLVYRTQLLSLTVLSCLTEQDTSQLYYGTARLSALGQLVIIPACLVPNKPDGPRLSVLYGYRENGGTNSADLAWFL